MQKISKATAGICTAAVILVGVMMFFVIARLIGDAGAPETADRLNLVAAEYDDFYFGEPLIVRSWCEPVERIYLIQKDDLSCDVALVYTGYDGEETVYILEENIAIDKTYSFVSTDGYYYFDFGIYSEGKYRSLTADIRTVTSSELKKGGEKFYFTAHDAEKHKRYVDFIFKWESREAEKEGRLDEFLDEWYDNFYNELDDAFNEVFGELDETDTADTAAD